MIQKIHYLDSLLDELAMQWPKNRTINIVCHGHSVPSGYFATPYVNTFDSYPHLLHRMIKDRFPFAVVNVIVTGIGGENSIKGAARFEEEVLNHKPDLITIDYSLNDRGKDIEEVKRAWGQMIQQALDQNCKVILCTPTWDRSYYTKDKDWDLLVEHAELVRALAEEYSVGLADSYEAFRRNVIEPEDLTKYLSHVNHPSKEGHMLVANEIAKYFVAR